MAPLEKEDYNVAVDILNFGNNDTATFSVTATQLTEWNEVQMEAPNGIVKVLVGSGPEQVSISVVMY